MAGLPEQSDLLGGLLSRAIEIGADELEIECKDGLEEVYALKDNTGLRIAAFEANSKPASSLLEQLYAIGKNGKRIQISGAVYRVRVTTYDSFGEDAFRVGISRV